VAIENQRKNHKPKENSYKKTKNRIFLLTNCQSNGLQNSDKAGNARASGGRHHAATLTEILSPKLLGKWWPACS